MMRVMSGQPCTNRIERVQRSVLRFLRAFEDAQQHIRFQEITASQRALAEAAGDALANAAELMDNDPPPAENAEFHRALSKSIAHLQSAQDTFLLDVPWPNFGAAYVASRTEQCSALEILYGWRRDLPFIEPYFRLASDAPLADADGVAVGIRHHEKPTRTMRIRYMSPSITTTPDNGRSSLLSTAATAGATSTFGPGCARRGVSATSCLRRNPLATRGRSRYLCWTCVPSLR